MKSVKFSEPLLRLVKPDRSVFANYELYGSSFLALPNRAFSATVALLSGPSTPLNSSIRLNDCLGLTVRPSPYFSPDGDLGGVNPFYVGDPGCFCIFVMKRGEGG